MPFLMLWRVLTTSPSSPTRTLTAYSSAPRRTSSASSCDSPMIRRLSASACWVRPRSSIRNAACSWARATIRSASSWAFSMIRSPSELIRFAARTSSGTATRSSSMSPRAAAWSMTTLFVRGSRRPFAMIDSRRSTRKMMSIGVASGGSRLGSTDRRRRLSHGGRPAADRLVVRGAGQIVVEADQAHRFGPSGVPKVGRSAVRTRIRAAQSMIGSCAGPNVDGRRRLGVAREQSSKIGTWGEPERQARADCGRASCRERPAPASTAPPPRSGSSRRRRRQTSRSPLQGSMTRSRARGRS